MDGHKLLILGNGFDLDLGLHTRYSDFWNSELWKQAKDNCAEKYLVSSLEHYRITHNWFDLESGLRDGAIALVGRLNNTFNNANYRQSFQLLQDKLKEYIANEQANSTPGTGCVAYHILNAIKYNTSFKTIYSFNYTDLHALSGKVGIDLLHSVVYLHGSLQPDDDIILGIEVEDPTTIPPQLTFLIKSNSPYYHYNNLMSDLLGASDVIFFGHSINGMDFPYFKDYFLRLSRAEYSEENKPHITIITYDNDSDMQIRDNFRFNGIDVRNLYNRVRLEFIHVKSFYDGSNAETDKLNSLIQRVKYP